MASSKRERELARMRAERQAARRAAEAARRRQRNAVIASVAAVAVLAAVVVGITLATRDDDPSTLASEPTPSAAPPEQDTQANPAGGCAYTPSGTAAKPAPTPPAKPAVTKGKVTLSLATTVGAVELALDAVKAPCTTSALSTLAAAKYFDGTTCHRLTTDGIFVLQCGDPTASGSGGPGFKYPDEALQGATYKRGTVAMANSGPGTNGSQFFLVYKDSTGLPANYTPVGTITKGLDLLDKVAKAGVAKDSPQPADGTPATEVKITTVTAKA